MSTPDSWTSAGTDEPLDKTRGLAVPGHWAIIGPEYPDGYGWTVIASADSADVAAGEAANEAAAMAAVAEWERTNKP